MVSWARRIAAVRLRLSGLVRVFVTGRPLDVDVLLDVGIQERCLHVELETLVIHLGRYG